MENSNKQYNFLPIVHSIYNNTYHNKKYINKKYFSFSKNDIILTLCMFL